MVDIGLPCCPLSSLPDWPWPSMESGGASRERGLAGSFVLSLHVVGETGRAAQSEFPVEGYAVFRWADQARALAELDWIWVAPEQRGRGLAGHLIRLFIESTGARQIWLEVSESNLSALRAYLRIGFVEVGRRPHYYQNGASALLLSFEPGFGSFGSGLVSGQAS